LFAKIIITEAEMLPVYEKQFLHKRVVPTDENAFIGAKFG